MGTQALGAVPDFGERVGEVREPMTLGGQLEYDPMTAIRAVETSPAYN